MLLKINKTSPTPIYQQIIEDIRSLIDLGTLEVGHPLPSSRFLANTLGINRSTIYHAYAELQALGYLESRPGSYNFVRERKKEVAYDPSRRSIISWENLTNAESDAIYETFLKYSPEKTTPTGPKLPFINLAALDLDPRLYPMGDFRRCVNQILLKAGNVPLQYGAAKGYAPLREYIARRLRLHGISVSEEEILITNGAQQALDLISRLFGGEDKKIVVEAPTYAAALPMFRFNRLKPLGVSMKPTGMDLCALEKVLESNKVSFVYTIPNFQNPTGITTSHHHRERLLNICLKYRVPIVEDGFEEDMKYYGKVALPLKSIDEKNIVFYLGTFSKALFPGLRIGWITADRECIQRIAAIKRFCDLSSSNLAQIVMHEFCIGGYYDKHLKRLHRIFRWRLDVALRTIKQYFPACVSWTRPLGGYTLWVKLPRKLTETELYDLISPFGISVSPGGYYFPKKEASEYFRVSISRLDEEEIREGLKRLGKALDRYFH